MSVHAVLSPRQHTAAGAAERTLRRLEQLTDERTLDTVLRRFLARRRAVRQALREQAAESARREHEHVVQTAMLRSCLAHLR